MHCQKSCEYDSDNECCCGKRTGQILFKKNFTKQPFDLVNDFMFFQITSPIEYIADDGIATQGAEGLVITSTPYTKRSITIFDHTKYLVFTQKTFDVPKIDAELFVYAEMTFEATGLVVNNRLAPGLQKYSDGITNIQDEPRISTGTINLADFNTGMIFDFIFSNEKIYALYEHLPLSEDTSDFTYAVPLLDRTGDLSTIYKLKIGYNRLKNRAVWYINNQEVFAVNNVGLMLPDNKYLLTYGGGIAKEVDIKSLSAGFGLFTLLDFFPAYSSYEDAGISYTVSDNLSIELVKVKPLANLLGIYFQRMPDKVGNLIPQTEFIYNGPEVVDGQGGILTIEFFAVGITKCCPITTQKTNTQNASRCIKKI